MSKVISVGGYKVFTGTMAVRWGARPEEEIRGDWLYRPDTGCWYCGGRSFPGEICEIVFVADPTKAKVMEYLLNLSRGQTGIRKALLSDLIQWVRGI